jgi:predicted GNAT superfamily acetyltransferase
MPTFTFKKCVQSQDQEALVDLVYSIKDELRLPDRATAEKVVNICFENGGIIAGCYGSQMVGMMGLWWLLNSSSSSFHSKICHCSS